MGSRQTKEEEELQQHAPFSKKELRKIRKSFVKVTGSPTLTELDREGFKAAFDICINSEHLNVDLDALFDSADVNHNGTVSFREFVLWLAVLVKGSEEAKLTHDSGVLDGEEISSLQKLLEASLKTRGLAPAVAKKKATQVMKKLYVNGYGNITLEEWVTVGKRLRLIEMLMGKELGEMQRTDISSPEYDRGIHLPVTEGGRE